jgi:hypothetical protein
MEHPSRTVNGQVLTLLDLNEIARAGQPTIPLHAMTGSPAQPGNWPGGGQAGPPADAAQPGQANIPGESGRRIQPGQEAGAPAGTRRISRLYTRARQATQLRGLQTLPDVVALHVERVRTRVNVCIWLAILLGLGFTMANVQEFAAENAEMWSTAWLTAWLIDPMVNIVLLGVLWAEQEYSRYEVAGGATIRLTKWICFATTYALNTWASWLELAPSGIVLHSVPPLVVLTAAEVGPVLRHRLTEAIELAYADAADPTGQARKQAKANRRATKKPRPGRLSAGQASRPGPAQAGGQPIAPTRLGEQADSPPASAQASDRAAQPASAGESPVDSQALNRSGGHAGKRTKVVSIAAQAGDAELVARILDLDAREGRRVGRDVIKNKLGVGSPKADRLRHLADQADAADEEVAG